ncbi:cleavage and polyadenylation specificity factor subunit 2-like [Physella acuta]|uniref:cleavage and polyadenylation specificity factor subunit 2-like n=1 Tax=Physella acuta TaxID=109671 RepID=UPI0027DE989A|nr:cleavage and polyadenylation specificity factor subunit 2-like [Physella acuta]
MTSIIKLHALSGARDESPPCYMLQVDEFRFLLDCGWDEDFSMDFVKDLRRVTHQVDAVLLTYPDHLHLGALPYLVGKGDLNCPIYATVPVYKMGQMFMYDLFQSRHNSQDFDKFTLDDVDVAFDKIIQLEYSQTITLKGKGHGLQITPLPAGHMIGGTIWKIVKDGEEEIVYAVDYNHKKERHLNGCQLDAISRPSVLITDTFNALYNQPSRRQRDEQLMTTILQTMRNDGNVLVAVDTAGRMLELAQLMDQMWRSSESGLTAYSLALLNNVSFNVVEFAKSQVEWMSDKVMRSFEDHRNNPFQLKHVRLCHNLAELARVPEPKVVLASTPDLQCGYSRDLFVAWCGNSKNSIILTNRTSPGTLARWLIDNPQDHVVRLEIKRRVKLEGAELDEYFKRKQEKELEESRIKDEQARKEKEEMESSDDSEIEMDTEDLYGGRPKGKHDLMIKSQGKARTGFFKQAKKSYPMFPFVEEKVKVDEYGEVIRAEDYIIAEGQSVEDEMKDIETKDQDDTLQDITEVPTKCISSTVTLDINAKVQFIDFEGRSDGKSIKKYLSQVKPKQLILIHGPEEATLALGDYCQTSGFVEGSVYCPNIGDVIDATTERHIYQVRLRDHLVSSLMFSKAKDMELAWVDGQLNIPDLPEEEEKEEEEMEDGNKKKKDQLSVSLPTLEGLPPAGVPAHTAVFINEPKLSDLKIVLISAGVQCEFAGGVLVCNNQVAVRRDTAGKMKMEGSLCEDYFKIRELLYQQYAIV